MKLLCITDLDGIEKNWEKGSHENEFNCNSVSITFFNLNRLSWDLIEKKIQEERFHLCLSLMQCDLKDSNLKDSILLNAVNNYMSNEMIISTQEDVVSNQPFIVNKSTSYFNVFLEIDKCISFTTELKNCEEELLQKNLSNLLIISSINYKLAHLFSWHRCNYYLLNYTSSNKQINKVASMFQDIIEKLD